MSIQYDITAAHHWFVGEDKTLAFDIIDENQAPLDVALYQLEWVLRRNVRDVTRLIVKTTGAGVTTAAGNGARVLVDIDDTDTEGLLPGRYAHALRRTDSGYEGLLSFGSAQLQLASAR